MPALLRRVAATRQLARGVQDAWPGDPRVNIQSDKGRAKAYQVRQVLRAIAKLEQGR